MNALVNLCDICVHPGHCCKSFMLHGDRFDVGWWSLDDAKAYAKERNLPFEITVYEQVKDPTSGEFYYAQLRWRCPQLMPHGRCGIYSVRPALCRNYAAGTDGLCAMYQTPNSTQPKQISSVSTPGEPQAATPGVVST